MDWSNCTDVERVATRMSGAWVVKNTRVPADAIVENAAAGLSPEQIVADLYPTVALTTVRRILMYADTTSRAVHTA